MLLNPDTLNADCTCISLDRASLNLALETAVGDPEFCRGLATTHPTLVSNLPVFLRAEHAAVMAATIEAIETIAKLPAYRDAALQTAPAIARFEPGPIGVFMGYDFHMGPNGPKLIEINTNAGGGLINAFVSKAQKACCEAVENLFPSQAPNPFGDHDAESAYVQAFHAEWHRQRGDKPLATIAIIDRAPESQYLYPEFLLFQRLFGRRGITAVIAPPDALEHRDGKLWLGELSIDLVYNRSTDFSFESADHASLRSAYLAGETVVSPNPWAHAMFADKRNLVCLTDSDLLQNWGVAEPLIELLKRTVPKTVLVTPARAGELWAGRNRLFFKPASGYGSKATYRGDKVTTRVWQDILKADYVAQALVPPSARTVVVDGHREAMKVDIRNYTYDGKVQLVAARLYQGQTTNFRTPGGGFAPVFWQRTDAAHTYHCSPGSAPDKCG